MADKSEGCADIQRGLDRLEKWDDRNLTIQQREVQSPALGKEKPLAPVHAELYPVRKQPSRKIPSDPDEHQTEHESAHALATKLMISLSVLGKVLLAGWGR